MSCRDLQIQVRVEIHDRVGMLHNVANHWLMLPDEHRHIEHRQALKSLIFSHLSGIDTQHGGESHLCEAVREGYSVVHSLEVD
jgi:hypothetical protein